MSVNASARPVRLLSPCDRIDLEERIIGLAAQVIRLRHPQSMRLEKLHIIHLSRYTDSALLTAAELLETWIAEQ